MGADTRNTLGMTRQEIIDCCLTYPGAYEDYPFDDMTDPGAWTAMRHSANKKTFAFIAVHKEHLIVTLKCDPFEADFLRQMFKGVTPGYHMNKTHWNTVIIDSDVSDYELKRMIGMSYDLIKPKVRKR